MNINKYVLELFLTVFLNISKTYHDLTQFIARISCDYINKYVLELFLNVFLNNSKTYHDLTQFIARKLWYLNIISKLKNLTQTMDIIHSVNKKNNFLWLSLGRNQYRREGLWFVCLFYDGSTRRLTKSGFYVVLWFYGEAGNGTCDPWFTRLALSNLAQHLVIILGKKI